MEATLMGHLYGLSDPDLVILDEESIVVWVGDDGYPTFGPHSRFSAIDLVKRCAMAKRSLATDDDWTAAIKAACAVANGEKHKPDVWVVRYDLELIAIDYPELR
jgi:hypothetical protein